MATYRAEADLPYAPEQVFDLVADIERYPVFLRHLAAARITRRDGNTLWVDQVVRIAMLRLRFRSRAVLERPTRIHVVCDDSVFGRFDEAWTFAPGPLGGTRLRCEATYELRSAVLRVGLGTVLGEILAATVRAFQARARQMYGLGA
jgi:coenzyme Q-binding protein COQ10